MGCNAWGRGWGVVIVVSLVILTAFFGMLLGMLQADLVFSALML